MTEEENCFNFSKKIFKQNFKNVKKKKNNLIFCMLGGSHCYNCSLKNSDMDYLGKNKLKKIKKIIN
jgi:hypothetical protein